MVCGYSEDCAVSLLKQTVCSLSPLLFHSLVPPLCAHLSHPPAEQYTSIKSQPSHGSLSWVDVHCSIGCRVERSRDREERERLAAKKNRSLHSGCFPEVVKLSVQGNVSLLPGNEKKHTKQLMHAPPSTVLICDRLIFFFL